jgi:copper(I)-binding protein
MHIRSLRTAIAAIGVAGIVVASGVLPAAAHEAPTPGTRCDMAGMVEDNHGTLYVCSAKRAGAAPTWSRGLTPTASRLTVKDPWAKAATSGMSAAFGVVRNPTARPIRIIGATSPYSAVVQLHEVVDSDGEMVMQEKAGGFVVPARGSLTLQPGGNHLMFMKLTKPIRAGQRIPVTLITADGGTITITALAKNFTGANEDYDPGMSGM